MSEISWLRERATAMRAAMECTDLPDAIDTVLDHLSSVESSRADALARVVELEGDLVPKPMSEAKCRDEAWFLAHVPYECALSLRWIPATCGDLGQGFVDQNNKPIEPVDWIAMPPREPDQSGEVESDG